MSSLEKVVQDYKCTLSDLKANNKLKINVLTILADDYKRYANEIVECIEEALYNAPDNLKLVHLYLIDSIIKNVTDGDYAMTFSRNIVNVFKHVFEKSDDRIRASLYKLRSTWANVFLKGKLYLLDVEVHALDSNWPIQSPKNGLTKAAVPTVPIIISSANNNADIAKNNNLVHVNPRFLNKNKVPAVKTTLPLPKPVTSESSMSSTVSRTSTKSGDSPLKAPVTMGSALKNLNKKPDEKETAKHSAVPSDPRTKEKSRPLKKISELGPIPRKKIKTEPKDENELVGQQRKLSTERVRKAKKEVNKRRDVFADNSAEKRRRVEQEKPLAPRSESWKLAEPDAPRSPGQNGVVVPTAALGSHAFNLPQRPTAPCAMPGGPGPRNFGGPGPFAAPPPMRAPFNQAGPFPAPPPSVSQFAAPPPAMPFAQPPPFSGAGPAPFSAPGPAYGSPGGFFNPAAPSAPSLPAHIKNETPRLPNVPGNNRIFVDGKAYEVFYLDNVAVIERNGVPHRISFCGPPRDVIIDGVAHRMAFGETKAVTVDGYTHYLRFGAPSRELYMGDYAFKGAFGGPPIIATIAGHKHEIRLMGPPPEVKIEQDPCYELMRHMQSIRQNDGRAKPEKKEISIAELLSNIQKAGVLSLNTNDSTKPSRASPVPAVPSPAPRKSPTPPVEEPIIPASMKLDRSEELEAPLASLAEFSVVQLQKRYRSVTRDLYEKRSACTDCGMQFEDMASPEYRRHLDAHLQKDIHGSDGDPNQYSRTRTAFQSEDDFILFSETDEENSPSSSAEAGPAEAEEAGLEQDAHSSDVELKECSACREPFQEYFDDDSDEWRLKDCVLMENKPFHRACRPDPLTSMDTS